MTLIEVVAGLALLAAVLVLIFAVKSHVARQQVRSAHRTQAVAAADALLASWWQDPAHFPRTGQGPIPGHPELAWRTQVIPNPAADALGAQTVRLEIFGSDAGSDIPPVRIEVVLPLPKAPTGNIGASAASSMSNP